MSRCAELRSFSFVTAVFLVVGLAGCNNAQNGTAQNPPDQPANVTTGDPANGNLASAQESGAPEQQTPPVASSGESFAPPVNDDYGSDYAQPATYSQPVEASEPPPPLPDYEQPPTPGDNYIWTPGSWNYASAGYYWVPGVWVLAPYVGALWTPPWWGFDNGAYLWHTGFWGPHIGFYGGIDYGFGYTGRGYYGAYWDRGSVYYNRSVTNVNVSIIHNVYERPVPENRGNRVSFNGGRGGINVRPTPQELAVVHDPRTPPVAAQVQHMREAAGNRAQYASGGRAQPAALVATRPLATSYKAPAARPPAAALRAATAPAPVAPGRPIERPGLEGNRIPDNRPAPQTRAEERPQAAPRPAPAVRQEARPEPIPTAPPRPTPAARPEPQARPEARPAPRPEPQARPEARPAPRPEPQARPEARPAPRPEPQARPEARPAPRPEPKPKEEEHK
jgi:hypothetical protein